MCKNYCSEYAEEVPLLREYVVFALSAVMFNGGKFLVEMIAAKELGPQGYGIWAAMFLIGTYATNLHLGVINGLGREIPFNLAKKNNGLIEEMKIVGLAAILLTIVIFGVSAVIYTYLFSQDGIFSNVVMLFIFYFVGYQLYCYSQYVLRAELRFDRASVQQGITGILIVLLVIPLLFQWRFKGLIAGYALALLIGSLCVSGIRWLISLQNSVINKSLFYHLIKIGFPIMAIGFLYTIIISVDKWIVITFLGIQDMGYYSFACNIFLAGMLFLNLLATQFYPRLSLQFGRNECEAHLVKVLKKQIKAAAILGVGMTLVVSMVVPIIVIWLMPEYRHSLYVAEILVFGLPFLGVALAISGYFNVIGKQRYLLLPMAATVATNLIISAALIKVGCGKEGVAISTVISYMQYCLLLYRGSLATASMKKYE